MRYWFSWMHAKRGNGPDTFFSFLLSICQSHHSPGSVLSGCPGQPLCQVRANPACAYYPGMIRGNQFLATCDLFQWHGLGTDVFAHILFPFHVRGMAYSLIKGVRLIKGPDTLIHGKRVSEQSFATNNLRVQPVLHGKHHDSHSLLRLHASMCVACLIGRIYSIDDGIDPGIIDHFLEGE